MKVLTPTGLSAVEVTSLRLGLDSLAGKVVGFIDNSMPNVHEIADDIDELLVARHGVARVVKFRKQPAGATPDAVMKQLTQECDAIIVGMGQ